MPSTARPDELDAIVAMIAAEQQHPDRNVVYLGDQVDGIRAELDDLDPDWRATVRVVHDEAGALVGTAVAEWDLESGRAWILGPWIAGDDEAWGRWARPLLDAVVAQVPTDVADREMSGTVSNERLAALAAELGWPPSDANYAYVLDADAVVAWTTPAGPDGLRPAVDDDAADIEPLHEAEFPASYFSVRQLLDRAARGEQVVLVAERAGGGLAGYAAGRVQPDGEGYIDFVAVDPAARGTGVGRRLVAGLARRLLPETTTGRVNLTVQEHRVPARALYVSMGFGVDTAFRGYRLRPPS